MLSEITGDPGEQAPGSKCRSDAMDKKRKSFIKLMVVIFSAVLCCWLFAGRAPILKCIAWWLAGLAPFAAVIIYRKRLPFIWIIGPLSVLVFLAFIEVGFRVGPLENRFLPMSVGKNFVSDKLLFWVPKDNGDGQAASGVPLGDIDLESIEGENDGSRLGVFDGMFRSGKAEFEKSDGAFRIMTMGGSNVWGYGIEKYEDTPTGQLEHLFKEKYPLPNFDFISAGVTSYHLFQNLVLYKLFLHEYKPDLVILYCNINDSVDLFGPYSFREIFEQNSGVDISRLWIDVFKFPKKSISVADFQNVLRRIRFYNYLGNAITGFRNDNIPEAFRNTVLKRVNSIEDYTQNLIDLITIVKKDGGEVILADAFCFQVADPQLPQPVRYSRLSAAMEKVAQDFNASYIPVHSTIAKMKDRGSLVFPNDLWHLNQKGHEFVAKILFEKIEENKLVDATQIP